MNKLLLLALLTLNSAIAVELPTQHASKRHFGKSIELNAQVIQLSNAKQSIMSLVTGHIENYYVKAGQKVQAGQKIALIESIQLSKMTADYIALKQQYKAISKNYKATQSLYKKGMTSMQDLNLQDIQKNTISAQMTAVASQLHTLGVNVKTLKQASANYTLYAHSAGTVSALLKPQHSVVSADSALISIVKDQAFYIKSYLPLEYAKDVKVGQKIVVTYAGKSIVSHVTQVLPELDEKTQRIVVLSSVDEKTQGLYINAYVASQLFFGSQTKYVAIEKTALSFFNNEWVVFIPKEDHDEDGEHDKEGEEHGKHEEHADEDHDEHEEHDGDEEEHGHDEHGEHGEHEEQATPFEARVVEVITEDENYIAVRGLEEGEEYVSDKSYYAKSMILKSSLGEHGH